ncbi:MAG: NAD-dependent dehydratase, partial [Pseudomonadota bacterium]
DDVAEGHLLAFDKGVIGERYILGGSDMRLKEILAVTARISGQPIPKICLPHNLLLPIAYGAEAIARVRGQGEPIISVDSLRMSKKLMFFTSKKAEKELGYHHRPADEAIADAVAWFRQEGYL